MRGIDMLKATEKALRASIKHWEVDGPKGVTMDGYNCALCLRFSNVLGKIPSDEYISCTRVTASGKREKCPVYIEAGEPSCSNTPWNFFPGKTQVKAEIKFLKSLLPEKKA